MQVSLAGWTRTEQGTMGERVNRGGWNHMATVPRTMTQEDRDVDYPTRDGRPMGETDLHRNQIVDLIETLDDHFAADPNVYVSGDLLVFYERGNPRKHLAPDVFVVRGVPKRPLRENYLIWSEGKAPEVVIEVTSKTTRKEDKQKKWLLYRDVLRVAEYFLFDPTEDYLKPPFQGFRLLDGNYQPIEPVNGRLPSAVLGLHLERDGVELRLYDPSTGRWLLTRSERAEAERVRGTEKERPKPNVSEPRKKKRSGSSWRAKWHVSARR